MLSHVPHSSAVVSWEPTDRLSSICSKALIIWEFGYLQKSELVSRHLFTVLTTYQCCNTLSWYLLTINQTNVIPGNFVSIFLYAFCVAPGDSYIPRFLWLLASWASLCKSPSCIVEDSGNPDIKYTHMKNDIYARTNLYFFYYKSFI